MVGGQIGAGGQCLILFRCFLLPDVEVSAIWSKAAPRVHPMQAVTYNSTSDEDSRLSASMPCAGRNLNPRLEHKAVMNEEAR
jgi:hypothetical protein